MRKVSLIYSKLQQGLQELPGEAAHVEMFPRRRVASEEIKAVNDYRVSAVLALFYENNGSKMVLTQRHDYRGSHSGQISFPGGKMEDLDLSPEQTALRETQEEIGLDPSNITVMGKLTDVYIPISKFLVHPYLGFFNGIPNFTPSEREVKEIITFDLNLLTAEHILQKQDIRTGNGITLKDVPCFIIEGKIVWGATALMLNEIRQMLDR